MNQCWSWFRRVVLKKQDEVSSIRIVYANDPERNILYPTNIISNTKYTLLTFFPKNVIEQFGKAMNIYFLFIGILQLIPSLTPVDPISTWGALVFIFAVSAIKEAYDDFNRYKRDKIANERVYSVVRNGTKEDIQSQQIMVGDIIYLPNDSEVPCDMVLLSTSDPEGSCYVQTSNLDGETDLKTRLAPRETMVLGLNDLTKFKGVIEAPSPNPEIYRFDSRLSMHSNNRVNTYSHSNWITLSAQNIVLQATHIRNTDYIYGIAVYTGNETKIGKNKKIPPTKWTRLDSLINQITIFIFCLQLTLVIVFGAIGESLRRMENTTYWYLGYDQDYHDPWYEFLVIPLRFLLLNSLMIPISLKVTIDVIKYAYALFINWDLRMYYGPTDSPAVANSTALSEDLGQIEYVFTDKTGTLTENIMLFARCSIAGNMYGTQCSIFQDEQLLQNIQSNNQNFISFFKALSLCHSVIPSKLEDESIQYKSSSPDEEALVQAAYKLNIKFIAKTPSTLTISIDDKSQQYQLLHTFDFTSDRKRMSVIIRNNDNGEIKIITKGADDMIFKRLKLNLDYSIQNNHLEEFASIGLRTLCIGERIIGEEEYRNWLDNHYTDASTSLENRQQRLAETYEMLEKNLELLGITAIEDKLQQGVPETIYNLRQASIKVWMLTGDKYSTAIQIAHSCNLVERGCKLYTIGKEITENDNYKSGVSGELTAVQVVSSIREIQDHISSFDGDQDPTRSRDVAIVVEGHVLGIVLQFAEQEFLQLCGLVSSVICCRVTPNQKALVVRMVKNTKKVCLAIGDGGNDVSMIQEANIGIGISGREGLQASRASDYSIARFKYLQELIFIHGRYSYLRTSFVANYCFYKSLFICFIQILYQLFSGFAGTTFFNSFSLTSYNILFTGLPVIGFILDRDIPQSILRRNPYLYTFTQEGKAFSIKIFITWALRSIVQAIIVFTSTVGAYIYCNAGTEIDYNSISMVSFTGIIFIQSLTLFFESNTITWVNHLLIWGTIPVYIVSVLILNSIPTLDMYSIMTHLTENGSFWGSFFLMLVTCMLPVITLEYLFLLYRPSINEIINQVRHSNSSTGGIIEPFFQCANTSGTSLNDDPPQQTSAFDSGSRGGKSLLQRTPSIIPEEQHNQRSKIITFLLYRKLTTPLAQRLSRRRVRGNKEVIELVVGSFDDDLLLLDQNNQNHQNQTIENEESPLLG